MEKKWKKFVVKMAELYEFYDAYYDREGFELIFKDGMITEHLRIISLAEEIHKNIEIAITPKNIETDEGVFFGISLIITEK
jgi:hypothetical protein